MIKAVHNCKKRILISGLIMAIATLSQISTTAFASTTTASKHKVASLNTGVKLGNVDTSAEQDFLNRTNALRASLGLGSLRVNAELLNKARNWSQTQANSGTIFHSTLTDDVTQNWQSLGENVGMGPDVVSIHNALVASPRHYQNLVDSRFTEVGIGVVIQNGTIYVSQVFMQFMPEQVAQTPATTPQTTPATTPPAGGVSKKSVGVVQAAQPTTTTTPSAPVTPEVPIAESKPFETASQELVDVVAKLHDLEN